MDGVVALITGGSRGLGRATALAFAREGAALALCARDAADLRRVEDEVAAMGAPALALTADLRSPRDIERLVALTFDRFGRIDVLVNNASELGPTPLPYLADYPPAEFVDVVIVDLVAPFRLTQAVIGDMLRRDHGLVINITSDVAVTGYAGWGAYAISKAGLDAMTRTWAAEIGDSVRMYSLDPGDMDTAMHRAALPEDDPAALLDPATVAPAIVDLATGAFTAPNGARLRAADILAARSSRNDALESRA
jgi:NAD(P)-dependent dehydrogenase (short-subunit alcohol dehydrogenase family)